MRLGKTRIYATMLLFSIPTARALLEYGYLGFFPAAFANSASTQVFWDLVISLSLVTTWMIRDARRRGIEVGLYVWITLFFGSFGPLLYLLRDEEERAAEPAGP